MTDDALVHFGKKGMKWGQHKAKKPSSEDIFNARDRQGARLREYQRAADKVALSTNPKDKKAAEVQAKKLEKAHDNNQDRATSARMTKGEKAVTLLLGGPLGLVIIGAQGSSQRKIQKQVNAANKSD